MAKMDLNEIVPKDRAMRCYKNFERTKSSRFLKSLMLYRIHFNRIAQSLFIVLSNPFIWRYIIRGSFMAAGGKNTLRGFELAITYKCNSRCEQCSCRKAYDSEGEANKRLSAEEFKNAVDQAVDMGAFQFSINGGEPMLEEELVYDLVTYIKKQDRKSVV